MKTGIKPLLLVEEYLGKSFKIYILNLKTRRKCNSTESDAALFKMSIIQFLNTSCKAPNDIQKESQPTPEKYFV